MLDAETKRRIDSCRDILVGKVPDPKSQVEQITIALIYKFMDDMDAEAEELGGKRSFFAGEYAKYGWAKLMAPNMGGFDVLALYSEAIGKMNENPGIPTLFRDIFKNAYLPYRDPETLRSFLKEINYFTYDHSEKLGDAFEYLLSVLGSQGDAGQFRTPRHIIDFMVEIVDPQKGERILDPACGTAGFLISAWKHILKHNTKKNLGDQLTPEQRAYIAANVHGYDISPDMVRLSLVNLYLHGFTDPHVVEYDTLTSEEKWNEYADVILANPPFMSPKGGIKPHKRFSVQATRSEVLFVDYIAEHLSPNGRAAIIVPEGIIFQSGTAYKQLRQMLVKNSLVAVISLPAGVFNPYSGVKTSILLLDKWLAKRSSEVLFIKVENDGFNLGAQRRAMAGSGLPDAAAAYLAFRHSQEDVSPIAFDSAQFSNAHLVEKTLIGENGEWALSGDRYVVGIEKASHFDLVPLGEVVEILDSRRKPITKHDREPGPYPYYGATGVLDYVKDYLFDEPLVLVGEDGAKWDVGDKTAFPISGKTWVNNHAHVLRPKRDVLLDTYLIEMLNEMDLSPFITGVTVPKLNQEKLRSIEIPLPPLAIQQEIVEAIDGYQKIINGARQVVDNYRPRIDVQPNWPIKMLSEVCEHITDGDHQPPPKSDEGVPFVTITNINASNELTFDKTFFVPESYYKKLSLIKRPQRGDVLYTVTGSFGIPVLINFDQRFCFHRHIALLRPSNQIIPEFLYCLLASASVAQQAEKAATGVAQKTIALGALRNFIVPVPPIEIQRAIVAEIEAEQALVNANKQLISRFEAKIKTTVNGVWGNDAI
jgi:type I restriction enzyme M protein